MKMTSAILSLLITSTSFAESKAIGILTCETAKGSTSNIPFLRAAIESQNSLSDIEFLHTDDIAKRGFSVEDHPSMVPGKRIPFDIPPYGGNNRYVVEGAGYLTLPADLSDDNLIRTLIEGLGYPNETDVNGLFLTMQADRDGHFVQDLVCRSTL